MFAAVVLLVAFRFPITVNFCLVPFKELIYLTAYVAPVEEVAYQIPRLPILYDAPFTCIDPGFRGHLCAQ